MEKDKEIKSKEEEIPIEVLIEKVKEKMKGINGTTNKSKRLS